MRFSAGEMVFHRLEIRSKATNVAEIRRKSTRGSEKLFEELSEAGRDEAIIKRFELKSVKV